MSTIKEFIKKHQIKMRCRQCFFNPFMDEDSEAKMDHYQIQLERSMNDPDGRNVDLVFHTFFSMGIGHKGKCPKIADVIDCIASDSMGLENGASFEDWAYEYGYDTDSRKAENTFQVCREQSKRFKRFLGDKPFNDLLFNTERL